MRFIATRKTPYQKQPLAPIWKRTNLHVFGLSSTAVRSAFSKIFRSSAVPNAHIRPLITREKSVIAMDVSNKLVNAKEFDLEEQWFILLSLYYWYSAMIKNLLLEEAKKIHKSLNGKD